MVGANYLDVKKHEVKRLARVHRKTGADVIGALLRSPA
jgi:hypothetical protein